MLNLYQKCRLARVYLDLQRPKMVSTGLLGGGAAGPLLFQPTSHLGVQNIQSRVNIAPAADDGILQPVGAFTQQGTATVPTSWRESVDSLSSKFCVLKDRKNVKLGWKPSTPFERRWIDFSQTTATDTDRPSGGIHFRFATKQPVPEISTFSYQPTQAILTGTATCTMLLRDRS